MASVAGQHRDNARIGIGLDRLAAIASALECAPANLLSPTPARVHVVAPPTSLECNALPLRCVLASNLQRWARRRGLLPADRLAQRAGMSTSQLYAMLGARVSASIDRLVPLASGLGVPTHVLVELDQSMTLST